MVEPNPPVFLSFFPSFNDFTPCVVYQDIMLKFSIFIAWLQKKIQYIGIFGDSVLFSLQCKLWVLSCPWEWSRFILNMFTRFFFFFFRDNGQSEACNLWNGQVNFFVDLQLFIIVTVKSSMFKCVKYFHLIEKKKNHLFSH